jgi:hypothetical protein
METKGDTQIVIHYDGSIRPSEIRIESIGLWVHFYDLLAAMMKEVVAKQLGGGGNWGYTTRWILGYYTGCVSTHKTFATKDDSEDQRQKDNGDWAVI